MIPAASLPRARRAVVALALALGALAGIAAPAGADPAPSPDPGAGSAAPEPADPPTVLVGAAGLRWTDIGRSTTPTLWAMIDEGAVASMSVGLGSTATCPLDAWTALSAGRRLPTDSATVPGVDDPADGTGVDPDPEAGCAPLPTVVPDDTSPLGPATVANWSALVPAPDASDTPATGPGQLGTLLAEAGTCTTAVGPGAAVMLADGQGRVERYAASLDDLEPSDLTTCDIVVVDEGVLPDTTTDRKAVREALDDDLSRLLDELPRGWHVLVAGIAETPRVRPDYQVVVDWSSPTGLPQWLTSGSTKRQGLVQLTDLTATLAVAGGANVEHLDGETVVRGDLRRMGVARTVENRRYFDVLSTTIETLMPALVGGLAVVLLVTLGGTLLARRSAARRGEAALPPRRRGRGIVAAIALLAAAAPVAASLATLSRWWVWRAPTLALTLSLTVATVAVAILAWAVSRFLPRSPMRLATAVAGLTWLVLTVDGLTGTTLQQGSLLGPSPRFGARFYGFNNMTFAVYAAAALLLGGSLATFFARERRRLAVAIVLAVGLVTTIVDGWPAFGADFGGILALVPSFAVLALVTARARITPRRLLVIAVATVGTVAVVSVVDWLLPGSSHLGKFVQRVVDGDAMSVIAAKAAGAWATVAHPRGIVVALAFAAAVYAALRPERCRLPEVTNAYARVPLLRPIVIALVVAAVVGSVLNDSGIVIAIIFLLVSVAILVATFLGEEARGTGNSEAASGVADGGVAEPGGALGAAEPGGDPTAAEKPGKTGNTAPDLGIRRIPTTLLTVGGGMLVVLLLAASVLTSGPLRQPKEIATAGEQTAPSRTDVLARDAGIVVVGTTGVNWQDVAGGSTPTLNTLLTDGAAAGGLSQPTGAASRCVVGGWVALSAGQLAEVATERNETGAWDCPLPIAVPDGDGARVEGWDALVALQSGSTYQARLGTLGDGLAGPPGTACATAVGPGAAVALARADGTVARYRDLDDALDPDSDAFDCPVTVIDAGDASAPVVSPELPARERSTLRAALRADRLAAVDQTVRQVLDAAPADVTVVVADTAGTPGTRPVLGVALARPGAGGPDQALYLTSLATRSDGVARVLDLPATILTAAGADMPSRVQDTPLAYGSLRPQDAASAAGALAELTSRDHVRRTVYTYFVDVPFYAGLALAGVCWLLGARRRTAGPASLVDRFVAGGRFVGWARGAALFLAAVPTAAFLIALTGWWRFDNPTWALAVSTVGAAAVVAGLGSLAPRRPVWLAPGIVAGVTFVVLTVDGLIGTPYNRASPLGSAPTFGARFYGFGNPTFSVYAVAALLLAAAIAQWLVRRGRRWTAASVVAAIGAITMLVDVWPTFGADLGGGLVLVPGFAVVGISASGARVTWRRVLLVGAVGVAAVAAVGVLDWLRPAEDRSHLGRFVGQVLDGEAWETLARKAGYAARSVLGGVPVWLTIAVIVASALMLFAPRRFTPAWFARSEAQWPLLRPTILGLWIMCVAGSLVNDFGIRIAMIALIPAVPLLTAIALNAPRVVSCPGAPGPRPCAPGAR